MGVLASLTGDTVEVRWDSVHSPMLFFDNKADDYLDW